MYAERELLMDENQKSAADLSPCVGICALDEEEVCVGCGRSNTEIRHWLALSDSQRREVLQKATERLKTL